MKKTFSYVAVFLAGFVLATLIMVKATAGIMQDFYRGVIHADLGYIELLDNQQVPLDREFFIREAEAALQVLGYNLGDLFFHCTEDTEQVLKRARKYVDEDKVPRCD